MTSFCVQVVARLAAVLDCAYSKDKEVTALHTKIAALEKTTGAQKLKDDLATALKEVDCQRAEVKRLESALKDQELAVKGLVEELGKSQAEVAAEKGASAVVLLERDTARQELSKLQNKMEQVYADSEAFRVKCQITVNRCERVIEEHMEKCPDIGDEAAAMEERPDSEFMKRNDASPSLGNGGEEIAPDTEENVALGEDIVMADLLGSIASNVSGGEAVAAKDVQVDSVAA